MGMITNCKPRCKRTGRLVGRGARRDTQCDAVLPSQPALVGGNSSGNGAFVCAQCIALSASTHLQRAQAREHRLCRKAHGDEAHDVAGSKGRPAAKGIRLAARLLLAPLAVGPPPATAGKGPRGSAAEAQPRAQGRSRRGAPLRARVLTRAAGLGGRGAPPRCWAALWSRLWHAQPSRWPAMGMAGWRRPTVGGGAAAAAAAGIGARPQTPASQPGAPTCPNTMSTLPAMCSRAPSEPSPTSEEATIAAGPLPEVSKSLERLTACSRPAAAATRCAGHHARALQA